MTNFSPTAKYQDKIFDTEGSYRFALDFVC